MPTASPYEQGVFRVNHPDVVAYVEAMNLAWSASLTMNGVLDAMQISATQNLIEDERHTEPRHAAEEWHAPWIPNGDYSAGILLEDDDDEDGMQRFDFRIHLVERGQLAGKRIVKVKLPGQSIYSGFAFVTRDGHLDLWRRFTSQANELHVLAAAAMLQAITDEGSRGDARYVNRIFRSNRELLSDTALVPPSSVFGSATSVTVFWRPRQLRCLHCNAAAVNPMPGPYPLCTDHSRVPERPVAPTMQTHGTDPSNNFATARAARRRRRSEAPVSVGGPLMSEVSGKFVR